MDSSNAEKAARAAYIAFHEGLSGFDAARAWDDMTSPADDWSQEAIDWTHAIKAALSSRDAEVAELTRLLAESRARFAGSEARRAELEAVIEKVTEKLIMFRDDARLPGVWLAMAVGAIVDASRSVVLEDRDREVAARALEDAADHFQPHFSVYADKLRERAAAIRKGDTDA